MIHIVLMFLLLAVSAAALADTPRKIVPIVAASQSQSCFVTMVPGKSRTEGGKRIVESRSVATAYRLQTDGSFEKLWEVKDLFSFYPYLSRDCRHMVTVEPGFFGHKPAPDHFGVSFFAQGKRLKRHRVANLVKDHSKLTHTVSFYGWLADAIPSPEEKHGTYDWDAHIGFGADDVFSVKTVDGIRYVFDVKTGDIKEAKRR